MLSRHIFAIASELGLSDPAGRDFPYDKLPKRIRDLYAESLERARRLITGGSVTVEMLDGLIRQYNLEKLLAAHGAPFLNIDDYDWSDEDDLEAAQSEIADDSEPPEFSAGDDEDGGVAVAKKTKTKKRG